MGLREARAAFLQWGQKNFTTGSNPLSVCFDGTNIWVANSSNNTVTKIKASDGSVVGTYTAGTSPWGLAFDGASIWVTNYNSNTLTKINASDGTIQNTFSGYGVGTNPAGIVFDGYTIWITNAGDNTVSQFYPNGWNISTYTVGNHPSGIAFDGTCVWVVNNGDSTVTKIDAGHPANGGGWQSGNIIGTYSLGADTNSSYYPQGVCFDGKNIWVANFANNTVTKVKASDGTIVGTYAVGNGPRCIAFDGTNIWLQIIS